MMSPISLFISDIRMLTSILFSFNNVHASLNYSKNDMNKREAIVLLCFWVVLTNVQKVMHQCVVGKVSILNIVRTHAAIV